MCSAERSCSIAIKQSDIEAIAVVLKIDGQQSLFVMLANDGTMNRMGYGNEEERRDLLIKHIEPQYFEQLRALVTEMMLMYAGRGYVHPAPQGPVCELEVHFKAVEGGTWIGYTYGAESAGPPGEVAAHVREAVAITDRWYLQLEQE